MKYSNVKVINVLHEVTKDYGVITIYDNGKELNFNVDNFFTEIVLVNDVIDMNFSIFSTITNKGTSVELILNTITIKEEKYNSYPEVVEQFEIDALKY